MNARQCVATLCFVAFLPSCVTKYTPVPAGTVPPAGQEWVRVTPKGGGAPVVLHEPQQMGDQYVGGGDKRIWYLDCTDCEVVSIPMDSIAGFEIYEIDGGKSALRLIGGAVLFTGMAYYVMAESFKVKVNPDQLKGGWCCD